MRRRLVPGLLLAFALGVPAAAQAESWTVAGPTAEGWRIVVTDRADTVCHALRKNGELYERWCDPSAPEPDQVVPFQSGAFAGFAGVGVAAVDAEWADGRRQRVETSDGSAYHGRLAGKVRYWLADPIERGQPWLLRRYGADGALIDAETLGPDPVVGPRRTLARGRGWLLYTETRRQLDPVADELDREVLQPVTGIEERRSTSWVGQDAVLPQPLLGYVRAGHRRLLYGLRGPGVERVDVRYGSGRLARAHVSGGTFWLRVPDREAIVAVEARDAAGDLIVRAQARIPPRTVPSVSDPRSFDTPVPEPDAPLQPFGGGLAALQEVGPWVCLQIDGWLGTEDDFPCGYVPREPEGQLMVAGPHGDDVVIAGLVHRDVMSAHFKSYFDGQSRTVQTEPAPGRWAAYARVFTMVTRNDLGTIRLRDAHGKRLGPVWAAPIWAEENFDPLPRVLGGPVGADRYCTELGEVTSCERINVLASCRARRVAVTVRARKHPKLRVITSDGRAHRARKAGRWWIYVAPRKLVVRALRWRGGRRSLGRVEPATRECGYAAGRR